MLDAIHRSLRNAIAPSVLCVLLASSAMAADAGVARTKKKPVAAKTKRLDAGAVTDAKGMPAAAGTPAEGAGATIGPDAPKASALAELKRSNAALKKVLQKSSPNWSPEAEAKNSDVRKIVGGFLDFEELGRRSLAKHWEGLTPKQRTDFVATLRELVERSYINQIHGRPDYDLQLTKETKTGNEASVLGTLRTKARGKKVDIALEYKMLWKNGRWVVYDVITDEQSLLENYRAEFGKIIKKESFDALHKRMKKKLEEKTPAP